MEITKNIAIFSATVVQILGLVAYLVMPLVEEYTSEWIQVIPW